MAPNDLGKCEQLPSYALEILYLFSRFGLARFILPGKYPVITTSQFLHFGLLLQSFLDLDPPF